MAMAIHPQPPSSSVTNHCYLHRSPPLPLPATTTTIAHQSSLPSPIYTSPSLNCLTRSPNIVVFFRLCHYRRSFSMLHLPSSSFFINHQSTIFNIELHQWLLRG
ncbi:hypothetical protein CsSME_00049835 [Camellia sinensis var. sinensis]